MKIEDETIKVINGKLLRKSVFATVSIDVAKWTCTFADVCVHVAKVLLYDYTCSDTLSILSDLKSAVNRQGHRVWSESLRPRPLGKTSGHSPGTYRETHGKRMSLDNHPFYAHKRVRSESTKTLFRVFYRERDIERCYAPKQ